MKLITSTPRKDGLIPTCYVSEVSGRVIRKLLTPEKLAVERARYERLNLNFSNSDLAVINESSPKQY